MAESDAFLSDVVSRLVVPSAGGGEAAGGGEGLLLDVLLRR